MSRRGWVLFWAMGVIWGVPYLLIKVSVAELAPTTLVLARTSLAALLLLPVALARGRLGDVARAWRPVLAFAVIEIMLPWVLLGLAEQRLSSSLTGLLIAGVPLVGAVLAVLTRSADRLDARRVAGLLLGLAGVAALVGFEVRGGDTVAVLALGATAVCYAVGPLILTRWLAHLPGIGVTMAALAVTAVVYLPLGLAQAPSSWPSGAVVLSVLALALLCTAVAFVVFFALVAEVGPTRATVITYVNPAVALVLGITLLGERFTAATALGFGLILAGSVLATRRSAPVGAGDRAGDRAAERVGERAAEPVGERACVVAEP